MPALNRFNAALTATGLISAWLLPTLLLSGCASPTTMGYGADRQQLALVSKQHPINRANKKTRNNTSLSKRLYHSPNEKRVAGIFNRLTPYADEYLDKEISIDWDVIMFPSKKSIAGALANGTMVMNLDFPDHPAMNDDALAYIIAHEIAHVIRQHHREKATWNYVVRPALIGAAVLSSGPLAMTAAAAHDFNSIAYSKRLEKEADLLGLELLAKAGFNPEIAVNVFRDFEPTLKKERPIVTRLPFFMTTHPSMKKRTRYSKAQLEQVMPLYEASKNITPLQAADPVRPLRKSQNALIIHPVRIHPVQSSQTTQDPNQPESIHDTVQGSPR